VLLERAVGGTFRKSAYTGAAGISVTVAGAAGEQVLLQCVDVGGVVHSIQLLIGSVGISSGVCGS